jgi:hypothetical protein
MKKITYLIIISILVFFSCSSDGKSGSELTQFSVNGKWTFSKIDTISDGIESLVDYPHAVGCPKDFRVFKGSNAGDGEENSYKGVACLQTKVFNTWVKSSDKITFKNQTTPEFVYTVKIIFLSSTQLKYTDGEDVFLLSKG